MQEISGNNGGGQMLVGTGASAGGVEALTRFFENAPGDGGLAYAVMLHGQPEHEGLLAELLQSKTEMPVRRVEGVVRVERDCVYCPCRPTGGSHSRAVT